MKLYDELCARRTELIRNRKRIEKGLNGAPKGSLRISHSGNRILYYWRKESSDRRGIYIGKADINEKVRLQRTKSKRCSRRNSENVTKTSQKK